MGAEVRFPAEPIDNGRCKFLVSEPLHAGGVRRFASPDEAQGSPLAEAIFAIPGADVAEVIVSGNLLTVVKRSPAAWQAVGKAVGHAIRGALARPPPGSRRAAAPAAADGPMRQGGIGRGGGAAGGRTDRRVRAPEHVRARQSRRPSYP